MALPTTLTTNKTLEIEMKSKFNKLIIFIYLNAKLPILNSVMKDVLKSEKTIRRNSLMAAKIVSKSPNISPERLKALKNYIYQLEESLNG